MGLDGGVIDAHVSWRDIVKHLILVWLPAFVALYLFAIQGDIEDFAGTLAGGLVFGLSAFSLGMALGLLFGVPRALTDAADQPSQVDEAMPLAYTPNTNLEQISDWLTKLLVGAGLTQVSNVTVWARNLGDALAPSLGGAKVPGASAVGVAIVLYFSVAGFLLGFLLTRVYLPGVFRRADEAARVRSLAEREIGGEIVETEDKDLDSLTDMEKEQVLSLYRRIIQLEDRGISPLSDTGYRRLARRLKRGERYREAVHAYERAYELNPGDPTPLNLAGVVLSRDLKQHDQAAELYRRALAVAPEYTSAVYNLACNEARRGNDRNALNLLSAAIAGDEKYREMARGDEAFSGLDENEHFQSLLADS